jgi:nitrate/TMAO reductase-like tetraheme cytochrome c subunit
MPLTTTILAAVIFITIALIILLILRPSLITATGGKILAFFALFVLPALMLYGGTSQHLEQSKSTTFCLSCHVMEPYGKSLLIDEKGYIPAGHFQNKRIPRERACYTCHTHYTMFGNLTAKLAGLNHMWVYYLGTIPEPIKILRPYQNRECLHCHAGARSFEENNLHLGMRKDLGSGRTSCLMCHSSMHGIANLDGLKIWHQGEGK